MGPYNFCTYLFLGRGVSSPRSLCAIPLRLLLQVVGPWQAKSRSNILIARKCTLLLQCRLDSINLKSLNLRGVQRQMVCPCYGSMKESAIRKFFLSSIPPSVIFRSMTKKSLSYWIIKAYRTITAQMQEYDGRPLLPTGSPIAALNNGSNAEDKVTFRVKKVYHSLIEF